jgi:hypothetical protein
MTRRGPRLRGLAVRWFSRALVIALVIPAASFAQAPRPVAHPLRFVLELEGGPAWQSYNDVEVPNDGTATRFSLADLAGKGPWMAGRLYLTWKVNERHGLRVLVAPFSLTSSGESDRPLVFSGATFEPGEPIEATYTFNSYRLSYRYRFRSTPRTTAWVGLTAKVRDAEIALTQRTTTARKDDLGFVPLLHVAGEWRAAPRWRVSVDADGLAGGPGRAVDAALKLGYDGGGPWMVQAGYRTLEGGADVPEVYSFAWLHYAVASVVWRW